MDQPYNSTSDDEIHIHENFNHFLRVKFYKKKKEYFSNLKEETKKSHVP